jgi:alpha-mannosidase
MRKNVFYGGHWCRWTDGRNNLTLIGTTGEKGFEYDPSSRRLGHYLLMTIPRDMTTWERFMTWAREGTGEHAFDCRILLHAPGTDLHAISKQAMEAQHPLLPVITNRLEPKAVRALPPERSFFSASDVQLSAFYRDRGRTILRLYEPAGRKGTARITLPAFPLFSYYQTQPS